LPSISPIIGSPQIMQHFLSAIFSVNEPKKFQEAKSHENKGKTIHED